MSEIIVSHAAKSFKQRQLFSDLSFRVRAKRLTALTGASGSGKSTLLNCIGLLDTLDSGTIHAGSSRVSRMGKEQQRLFRRDALGYMFQNYALIENARVNQNLEVAVAAKGRRAVKMADFDAALARVGLKGRGNEQVYSLSGGEQQRVALARLIIKKPSFILADEPTGALDAANAEVVLGELDRLAQEGAVVMVATHSPQVVSACTDMISLDHLR
ncbi:ATP-binding cassette domain-containing protein [Glutamicibacter arilaitensis]|uniref:ATP-binding cassette domain-containing protein n=1 Tax=Glutamicibacter arilaitensis TaxID=256701 RepID=UPI003A8DD10F